MERVHGPLVAGKGVDSCHVAALDAAQLVQYLCNRCQAIGCAGRV